MTEPIKIPEGLIIPEGFVVNEVHLIVLDALLEMIIPNHQEL